MNLSNIVSVLGNYNNIPTKINSDKLIVTMIDGLKVTMTADKMVWADGLLTYTIVINNNTDLSYVAPVITDVIDTSMVSFVNESVTIDGVKADNSKYSYEEASGTLTINLDDIASSKNTTITFQVSKKA